MGPDLTRQKKLVDSIIVVKFNPKYDLTRGPGH